MSIKSISLGFGLLAFVKNSEITEALDISCEIVFYVPFMILGEFTKAPIDVKASG